MDWLPCHRAQTSWQFALASVVSSSRARRLLCQCLLQRRSPAAWPRLTFLLSRELLRWSAGLRSRIFNQLPSLCLAFVVIQCSYLQAKHTPLLLEQYEVWSMSVPKKVLTSRKIETICMFHLWARSQALLWAGQLIIHPSVGSGWTWSGQVPSLGYLEYQNHPVEALFIKQCYSHPIQLLRAVNESRACGIGFAVCRPVCSDNVANVVFVHVTAIETFSTWDQSLCFKKQTRFLQIISNFWGRLQPFGRGWGCEGLLP